VIWQGCDLTGFFVGWGNHVIWQWFE